MVASERVPVRMVVTIDANQGFDLTPDVPPLPDVPPGGTCTVECIPDRDIVLYEVRVKDFVLVELSLGAYVVEGGIDETRGVRYIIETAVTCVDEGVYEYVPCLPDRRTLVEPSIDGDPDRSVRARSYSSVLIDQGRTIRVVLRNESDRPKKPKTAGLLQLPEFPMAMARPEDAVACPACGHPPGDSCDGPTSHPSRVTAHQSAVRLVRHPERVNIPVSPEAKDWVIGDIKITNRCGFCGEEFGVRAKHVCSKAAIDPIRGTMLTAVDPDVRPGGSIDFTISGAPEVSLRGPEHAGAVRHQVHAPQVVRTLYDGPGNRILVRGCSCGADVQSTEAFADHVGWPVDAVQSMLHLAGIVYDVLDYPDATRREDVERNVALYLQVRDQRKDTP